MQVNDYVYFNSCRRWLRPLILLLENVSLIFLLGCTGSTDASKTFHTSDYTVLAVVCNRYMEQNKFKGVKARHARSFWCLAAAPVPIASSLSSGGSYVCEVRPSWTFHTWDRSRYTAVDPLDLGACRYDMVCRICVVQIQPRKQALDHADLRLAPGNMS